MDRLTRFFSKSMSVILNLNFLTDGQNVLRFVDSLVGDLRNVDQTVNAWDDLSECTESSHGNNFSGNYAANFVISLENFPRIVLGFLVAQGDLFVFNVDVFSRIHPERLPTLTTSEGCLILSQDSSEM